MVPPTDKHPAQVKELMEDVPIGTILVQEWSSLLTPAQKGGILDRVEELIRVVKKARSRANEAEVNVGNAKIAARIIDHIFEGI